MQLIKSENIQMENKLSVNNFISLSWYWQWLAFSLLALALYFPIIDNTFINDDHLVLLKVGVQQELNVDGFFRPLSDITLWITYRLFGLNPIPFHGFQILVHALNAVLLLQYCYKLSGKQAGNSLSGLIALLAGILFLTYPFHNEAIAWILARSSLMAGSLAIASMLALVSDWKLSKKIAVIAVCYFVGMASYETIMVLPLMVAAQMLILRMPVRQIVTMLIALGFTFAAHTWLRIAVSGVFMNSYGKGFFQGLGFNTLLKMLKSAGRIFLPPSDNSGVIMIGFVVAMVMLGTVLFIAWKRSKNDLVSCHFFYIQLCCFIIAMSLPMMLGVSTRTSESDRFLYLPSLFFCSLLAFGLVYFFKQAKMRIIIVVLLLFVQVALLQENNSNWKRASKAVEQLLGEVKKATVRPGRLLIVNMPGEIDGAFVFRIGFSEALRLYNYDSSKVKVVSSLTRDEELMLPQQQVRFIAERPDMLLVQPSTLLFKTDGNQNNEPLESSAGAGKLQQMLETMISQENEWSFASAARANQIRMIVYRHKLSWKKMRIGVLHPEDRYFIWDLHGWVRPAF